MLDEHQVVDYQLCKAKQSAVVLLHGTQRVSEARVKKIQAAGVRKPNCTWPHYLHPFYFLCRDPNALNADFVLF